MRPPRTRSQSQPAGQRDPFEPLDERAAPPPQSSFSRISSLALQVLRKASAEFPADMVLRDILRQQTGLGRDEAQRVSEKVFAYYRWKNWYPAHAAMEEVLEQADERDWRFVSQAKDLPVAELLEKAIPEWAQRHLECKPEWLRTLQRRPALWLRTKESTIGLVKATFPDCHAGSLALCPTALEYAGPEDLFRSALFHEGAFELQDIASQAVGALCAPQPGETWWDACAGEGGKLLHLSDLMQNKGLIWASDRAEWRLQKLKRRAARAGAFNYRSALWDGGKKLPTKTLFDGVLVDAPCSGIGTWQRNPHARWTTTETDVQELAEVQLRLLRHVSRGVKPGGKLVYSVCTLSRAETSEVCMAFEASVPGFEPMPLAGELDLENPSASQVCIWPQDIGGNGMFVAAWRRVVGTPVVGTPVALS